MDGESTIGEGRRTVLEMFGLELQVSNPRLAELLTMDAAAALVTDLHDLTASERIVRAEAEAAEAAPDVVLAAQLPRDAEEARRRHDFRRQVQAIGSQLGFAASPDGVWRSSQGVTLVTRAVDRPLSWAAAAHFVSELAGRRVSIGGEEATALFIVDSRQAADVFAVAVRQQRLHGVMRTISLDDLREIGDLAARGDLGHQQAVVLLTPMADIDVGELLSILHAVRAHRGEPAA